MPPPRSGVALAALAVALVPLGVLVYLATMDAPWWRATGFAALPCVLGAVALGLVAVRRDPRLRVRLLAVAALGLAVAWVYAFYGWARLPAPAQAAVVAEGGTAPDFTLSAASGGEVTLSAHAAAGPTLLVFHRGHW